MKNLGKLFAFALVALGLAACGNNNTNPNQYQNGTGYYNQNGQWVQTGATGTAGCVPLQSGALSFTAQGASVNGAVILAGMLPANSTRPGQYGQVTMGTGAVQQNYAYGAMQLTQSQTSSGAIQMNVSQNVISGVIQLNQSSIQALMAAAGSQAGVQTMQYPYNNYNSNLCVTSVAIDAVYYAAQSYQMSQGVIRQALVYFYLSNGQPIGPLPFYSGY